MGTFKWPPPGTRIWPLTDIPRVLPPQSSIVDIHVSNLWETNRDLIDTVLKPREAGTTSHQRYVSQPPAEARSGPRTAGVPVERVLTCRRLPDPRLYQGRPGSSYTPVRWSAARPNDLDPVGAVWWPLVRDGEIGCGTRASRRARGSGAAPPAAGGPDPGPQGRRPWPPEGHWSLAASKWGPRAGGLGRRRAWRLFGRPGAVHLATRRERKRQGRADAEWTAWSRVSGEGRHRLGGITASPDRPVAACYLYGWQEVAMQDAAAFDRFYAEHGGPGGQRRST